MPVGDAPLPDFFPIRGVQLGVANAGIKQKERPDLTIIALPDEATVAGVFTQNAFCAAPVQICRKHLSEAQEIKYLVINTGNANAGTGEKGLENAKKVITHLAAKTNQLPENILPFSTGVIGEHLPADKIINAFDSALENLDENHWHMAAKAIMTTDTRPKGVSRQIEVAGETLHISGVSKGAGMIKPNMATMLGFVAMDAKASNTLLQDILSQANKVSFNRITVDGDTSTNDSAILMASGSGIDLDSLSADDLWLVKQAINLVFVELAQLIVRDGEGATKFVHVHVTGGASEIECEQVAYAVAHSPLVKTALFASDPNWGRILAAVGYSGVNDLDVDKVSLAINDVLIAEHGGRAESYSEEQGVAALSGEDIVIHIDLARGEESATVWTTDLSHDYVTINAEYRT